MLQEQWFQWSSGGVMATTRRRSSLCFLIGGAVVLLLVFFSHEFRVGLKEERLKRDILDSSEIPVEHIDPAAIDLTPLVNTLINTSQSGSRQLFSLLSVTSYSSLALHKLTLLVYNISSIRSTESNPFRRRFCYCVSNETNDLTDFTAILLDVMGNSTSYLHELFKSASILSVSQKNNSDCIYICVMAGKMGREVSDLWEVDSITPLFNQTIIEGPHRIGNISSLRLPFEWQQPPSNLSHIAPSGMSAVLTSRVHAGDAVSPTTLDETPEITTAAPPSPADQPETTARAMTTQEVTTARAMTTQEVTTARAMTTQEVRTARAMTTQEVRTARAMTTQEVTTARAMTTQEVTTARAMTTQEVRTARAMTTQEVTTARAMTTQEVTTARAMTTQEVTTARAMTTQEVTTARAMTTQEVTTARAMTTQEVRTARAMTTQEVTTARAMTTQEVTTASAMTTQEVTTARAMTTQEVTTARAMTTQEVRTAPTTSTLHPTRPSPGRPTAGPTVARRTTWSRTTTPSRLVEEPGCPWRRPELTDSASSSTTTTVGAHKLQPCVLELCRFFSECLCRPFSYRSSLRRYCDDSHMWYEKHTSEVCRRVRRLSFSRNLKQRCLTKMCTKL